MEAQSAVFVRRLQRQFPLGSAERTMAAALARQGFVQTDWGGATGTRHNATRIERGFPCETGATVEWRADERGKLVWIDGIYGWSCL